MSAEDDRVLDLASAISDGAELNWEAESHPARGAIQEDLLRALRLVSNVAEAHRRLQPEDAAAMHEIHDMETVTTRPRRPLPQAPGDPKNEGEGAEGIPAEWGPLKILEMVGRGAFGDIFRAWDTRLDREVALKLLRAAATGHAGLESEVIREGQLLARVRHPNVITVHGAERRDGRVGLWMEFVRGRTLADLLREQGAFGAREAALIGLDLCRALAAVHAAGLLHRDLKAQNVMREEGGRILLMDFGAGRDIRDSGGSEGREVTGTPLYMAPEVLLGKETTKRSDIYSLGVLLYHLVTGEYPIKARTLRELREAHDLKKARLLRDVRPDLPESYVQVVERALAAVPENRFASAGEMEMALGGALAIEDRGMSASRQGTFPARRTRRTGSFILGLGPLRVSIGLSLAILLAISTVLLPRWNALEGPSSSPRHGTTHLGRNGGPAGRDARATPEGPSGRTNPSLPEDRPEPPEGHAPGLQAPTAADAGAPIPRPLEVAVKLYLKGGLLDNPISTGGTIRPGDQLFADVESAEPIHVYVLNQDSAGNAYVLFPLPGADLKNPLQAHAVHRLPGTVDGARASWVVSSAGGRESFLILASRRRLVDLEEELSHFDLAQVGRPVEVTDRIAMALHRGIGGLAKAEPHPAAGGKTAERLHDLLQALLSNPALREEVWTQEMIFNNPGQ